MSGPMATILGAVIGTVFFAVCASLLLALESKMKIKKRELELARGYESLEKDIERVAKLSKRFEQRPARYVGVTPMDSSSTEYKGAIREIASSLSFQWFMYKLREGMVSQIKNVEPGDSGALTSKAAFLTAIDEIQNAMAIESQQLIDLEQREEDDDEI